MSEQKSVAYSALVREGGWFIPLTSFFGCVDGVTEEQYKKGKEYYFRDEHRGTVREWVRSNLVTLVEDSSGKAGSEVAAKPKRKKILKKKALKAAPANKNLGAAPSNKSA